MRDVGEKNGTELQNGMAPQEVKEDVVPQVESKKVDPQQVDPKKVEPTKVEPQEVDPKKDEPNKVEPKKVDPKKDERKKVEPKKVDPKKDERKKVEPKKKVDPKKDERKKEKKLPRAKAAAKDAAKAKNGSEEKKVKLGGKQRQGSKTNKTRLPKTNGFVAKRREKPCEKDLFFLWFVVLQLIVVL